MVKIRADYSSTGGAPARPERAVSPALSGKADGTEANPAPRFDDAIDDQIAAIDDRLAANDYAGARAAAAELRRRCWNDAVALAENARRWLAAESPIDAARDAERAIELEPGLGDAWAWLGLARSDLGERGAALLSLERARRLEPDKARYSAVQAAIEAGGETGWSDGLRRLIEIQEAEPGDQVIRDLLIQAYLDHARRDWTEVEAEEQGSRLVRSVQKLVRLMDGADIPQGRYPTTAEHVKRAEECLSRAQALGTDDTAVTANLRNLAEVIADARARHYSATWGETGLSIVGLVGGFTMIGSVPVLGLLGLITGGAMLMGGFVPQYRTNRILLSRRGKTVGESLIGLAAKHQYGGFVYLGFLMAFYPFIAAYRFHQNWGQHWLAKHGLPGSGSAEIATVRLPTEAFEVPDCLHVADEIAPVATAEAAPPRDAEPQVEAHTGPSAIAARLDAARAWLAGLAHYGVAGRAAFLFAGVAVVAVGLVGGGAWAIIQLSGRPSVSQAGVAVPAREPEASAVPSAASGPAPGPAAIAPIETAPAPQPVSGAPRVIDTATLAFGDTVVRLSGITGAGGIEARQMASFIAEQGGYVVCEPQAGGLYRCRTGKGYDLAAAALTNGAARAAPGAPEDYLAMETQARDARRGVWQ